MVFAAWAWPAFCRAEWAGLAWVTLTLGEPFDLGAVFLPLGLRAFFLTPPVSDPDSAPGEPGSGEAACAARAGSKCRTVSSETTRTTPRPARIAARLSVRCPCCKT